MMIFPLIVALSLLGLSSAACSSDSDCTALDANLRCCRYTHGNASSCYDIRYQKCCANAHCNSYLSCCNTTCCSDREACKAARNIEGDVDMCSSIERWDVIRHFTSFGVPIVLGFFAILAYVYAFVLFIVHRVRFTMPLILVIVTSAWCWIWAVLMLVSQFSLAAFLLCAVTTAAIAALAAIAPAHAPTQVITVTLAAVAAAFLMMINPFASNSLFSFAPLYKSTAWGGVLGRALTGLSEESLHEQNLNPGVSLSASDSCPGWYNGYWRRDQNLYFDGRIHDSTIIQEPRGLCGRHYQFYIAIIATFETAGLPLLFLALVARLWEVRGASADMKVAPETGAAQKAEA